jgi:LAS superfamily LD-carboxypeptidase LdcB
MKRITSLHPTQIILGVAIIVVVGISYISWTNYREIHSLSSQVASLASTTLTLQDTLTRYRADLASGIMETKQNVGAIQSQLGTYKEQVGDITGTVSTLQKLSKTDPQLLEKYSKVFFLNENYAPAALTELPADYRYGDLKHPLISTPVWAYLKKMLDAAASSGIKIDVQSGYRSFTEQISLKGGYKVVYGAGTANSFSADQGYSEHQLGTAVDFTTPTLAGGLTGFENSTAYDWLNGNAYKYGFILSYPEHNPFYVYEPWHWRFVGVKLATDLHNANQRFYDWDQRTIDTYLVNLFD